MKMDEAIKILRGIEGRVIFDKGKYFFSKERTWKEASASVPLDPETTPKRYDVVSEAISHAEQVQTRLKTGKATRFIDTRTEELESGVVRAVEYLRKIGRVPGKEDKPWTSKDKTERPIKAKTG